MPANSGTLMRHCLNERRFFLFFWSQFNPQGSVHLVVVVKSQHKICAVEHILDRPACNRKVRYRRAEKCLQVQDSIFFNQFLVCFPQLVKGYDSPKFAGSENFETWPTSPCKIYKKKKNTSR
ncbi:unnamed protein product [Ixodes pacificus]